MIPFVRAMDFEYGVPARLTPLIRRVVARNPGAFTFLGTGTYVIGSGEVAVIDPGPLLDEHLQALLQALETETVAAILTTHTHVDHSPLARPLQEKTGARIYGRADPKAGGGFEEASDARFKPDVEIEDGATISGPGWTLEALATPGHASNHVCYGLLEENALFCGDHVMGWSTTVISPPDGDMTAYYASLKRTKDRGYATLWPTHGPPITDVDPFLDAYLDHRLTREAQIIAEISQGRRHIRDMVPVLYRAVDPKLHPAAAHSVLAHLVHLTRAGVVTTPGAPTIDAEYALAT